MSTDLLGHPIADPPPMTAPLPWRVFQMSDVADVTDWVMARTEREAVAFYVEFCNECGDWRSEEQMRKAGSIANVRELTDSELANMDLGDTAAPDPDEQTFAQHLAAIALHAKVPMFFASTEY